MPLRYNYRHLKTMIKLLLCIFLVAFSFLLYSFQNAKRKLTVCHLFSDHMVLQQQANVAFWGETNPEQKLTVSASWGKPVSTHADADGNWKINIPTPKAGGPYAIRIQTADTTITIKDVLIGEVWLASGQSNMDLPLKGWLPDDTVLNAAQEIAGANYPQIRLLKVPFNISATPIDSIGGEWLPASPETAGNFSATAYFFARKLYKELGVPIGIIQSSIGGTPAEAWTSKDYLKKIGDFDTQMNGLETVQSTTANWFNNLPFQAVPTTDTQWQNIDFSDSKVAKTNFDDSRWTTIQLPGRFDKMNSEDFDGAMWFRKEFSVEDTTTDYVLNIGAIDDMDATYINGQKIGGLAGEKAANAPRKMVIPKSLLAKGKNVIAIRAIDTGGPGSISGTMTITNDKGVTIPLEGAWKCRLIAEIYKGKFYTYNLQTDFAQRPHLNQLNSNTPTVLFNAMIHPLVPYTIKGVIWYQGESNVGKAEQYKRLFPNMIEDWRNKWGYEFPFYFVQIAPFLYTDPAQKNQSQKLRDAQRLALQTPKTGMAVTLDVGKLTTAHPAFKQTVGDRLALFALANEYGRKGITSGPLYKKATVSGNKMTVEFSSVGGGLLSSEKGLFGFEIAGKDKAYVPAQAHIVNNKVVVSSPAVAAPVFVRYAWSDSSSASLFNKEKLPASTFTSEDKY